MKETIIDNLFKHLNINHLIYSGAILTVPLYLCFNGISIYVLIIGGLCIIYSIINIVTSIFSFILKWSHVNREKYSKAQRIKVEQRNKRILIEQFYSGLASPKKDYIKKTVDIGRPDRFHRNIRIVDKNDTNSVTICRYAESYSTMKTRDYAMYKLVEVDDMGNDVYNIIIDERLLNIVKREN